MGFVDAKIPIVSWWNPVWREQHPMFDRSHMNLCLWRPKEWSLPLVLPIFCSKRCCRSLRDIAPETGPSGARHRHQSPRWKRWALPLSWSRVQALQPPGKPKRDSLAQELEKARGSVVKIHNSMVHFRPTARFKFPASWNISSVSKRSLIFQQEASFLIIFGDFQSPEVETLSPHSSTSWISQEMADGLNPPHQAGINSYNFFPAVDHEIDEQLKSEMKLSWVVCCGWRERCDGCFQTFFRYFFTIEWDDVNADDIFSRGFLTTNLC